MNANDAKLKIAIGAERSRRDKEWERNQLHKDAVRMGICPDCCTTMKDITSWFTKYFGRSTDYECGSCNKEFKYVSEWKGPS